MDTTLKIILIAHIIGGSVAGLTGLGSILTKKGSRLHKRSGIIFYYTLAPEQMVVCPLLNCVYVALVEFGV